MGEMKCSICRREKFFKPRTALSFSDFFRGAVWSAYGCGFWCVCPIFASLVFANQESPPLYGKHLGIGQLLHTTQVSGGARFGEGFAARPRAGYPSRRRLRRAEMLLWLPYCRRPFTCSAKK